MVDAENKKEKLQRLKKRKEKDVSTKKKQNYQK